MSLIRCSGNDKETYDLIYNNEIVAELLVGEDGAQEIADKVRKFIFRYPDCNIVIQNDSDDPFLGVIIDAYMFDGHIDSIHFMFDDFIDE